MQNQTNRTKSDHRTNAAYPWVRSVLTLIAGILLTASLSACDIVWLNALITGSESPPWKNVYETEEGTQVLLTRKDGIDSIVIYIPESTNGVAETHGIVPNLMDIGFGVMTLKTPMPRASASASASASPSGTELSHPQQNPTDLTTESSPVGRKNRRPMPESSRSQRIPTSPIEELYTISRVLRNFPDVKNRLLVVHGDLAIAAFLAISYRKLPVSGLVVLNPDIEKDFPTLRKIMIERSLSIPILWVTGQESQGASLGHGIKQKKTDHISIHLKSDLNKPSFADIMDSDVFTNFALIQKHSFTWKRANQAFPLGCSYSADGRARINTEDLMASGIPEPRFCPLFLISLRGKVYRAMDASRNHCDYRLSRSTIHIYCHFPRPQHADRAKDKDLSDNTSGLRGSQGRHTNQQTQEEPGPGFPQPEAQGLPAPHQNNPG